MIPEERMVWISHQNKRILYADYSTLTGEDLMVLLAHGVDVQQQAGKDVLVLTNFTNASLHTQFVTEIKNAGKVLDQDMKKAAAFGLNAMQKILYNGYVRFTGQKDKVRAFDAKEEALNWLTQD